MLSFICTLLDDRLLPFVAFCINEHHVTCSIRPTTIELPVWFNEPSVIRQVNVVNDSYDSINESSSIRSLSILQTVVCKYINVITNLIWKSERNLSLSFRQISERICPFISCRRNWQWITINRFLTHGDLNFTF